MALMDEYIASLPEDEADERNSAAAQRNEWEERQKTFEKEAAAWSLRLNGLRKGDARKPRLGKIPLVRKKLGKTKKKLKALKETIDTAAGTSPSSLFD